VKLDKWSAAFSLLKLTMPYFDGVDDATKETLFSKYVGLLIAYKKDDVRDEHELTELIKLLKAHMSSHLPKLDSANPHQRMIQVYAVWSGDESTRLGRWADSAQFYELALPGLEQQQSLSSDVLSRYYTVVEDYVKLGDYAKAKWRAQTILLRLKKQLPAHADFYAKFLSVCQRVDSKKQAK
jgi:hypothetical protein